MNLLIDCRELAERLAQPQGAASLALFDCRSDVLRPAWGRSEYLRGHLPGARFADVDLDLAAPPTPDSGRHPLPDAQRFATWLGEQGVDERTEVIAYDQGHGAYAARLWWLLRSRGHVQTRLLDGGWAAWRGAGLPVSAGEEPLPTPGVVQPRDFSGWLDTAAIEAGLATGALLLVDARSPERFAGLSEPIDPVAGRVPGAVNRPFTANLDETGHWLPAAQLRAQWLALLAAHPAQDLAVMCGSGVTACHHVFALERAGLPAPRLYAGSFSEWLRDPARPVSPPAARSR